MRKIVAIILVGIFVSLVAAAQIQTVVDSNVVVVEQAQIVAEQTQIAVESTEDASFLSSIISKIASWYETHMNYWTIAGLMVIESSCLVPFPSEIVITPAAFFASQEDSSLNIFLVILAGTIGALIGAYGNYALGYYLGRPVIYRFADSRLGRILFLNREKIEMAEDYFNRNGKTTTFVGRLIPGIRQVISLPAGMAKMNFWNFTLYTFLGAGIWNIILALVGVVAYENRDLIYNNIKYVIVGLVIVAILYVVLKKFITKKMSQKAG